LQELKITTRLATEEFTGKAVTLFFQSQFYVLAGSWYWDLMADAVFCSDIIFSLPTDFEGTKGIIHPDDVDKLKEQLQGENILQFDFRIITTYGEVKTIIGQNITIQQTGSGLDDVQQFLHHDAEKEQEWKKDYEKLLLYKEAQERASRYTNTGIWWYNDTTHETWYSAEIYRIYDLPPFSLNPHLNTFNSFIHPEERSAVEEFTDKAFAEKAPLHIEYRIATATGEKHVLHTTQWTFNSKGEYILSGMLQDVTAQRANETEQEELENKVLVFKHQLVFDEQNIATGHWQVNLVTRKTSLSDNYYRIFGLRPKSVSENFTGIIDYVHSDDHDLFKAAHRDMLHQHKVPEIEFRIVRTDGKVRYISQKARLVTFGNEIMMLGFIQDVTVQKNLEKKIKEHKGTEDVRIFVQRQMEEMAGLAGWVWNTTTNKILWSENFYKLLGLKHNAVELSQKKLISFIHPEDQKRFSNEINLVLEEKRETIFQTRLMAGGKVKHLRASFRLMKNNEDELFIATLQDITDEHNLKQQVAQRIQLAEALSENILDRVIITDTDNTIITWNGPCEEAYGIKKDQALGKNFFDVFPRLKTEEELQLFTRVLRGESVYKQGNKGVASKGYYNLHMLPLWNDEQAEVAGVIHILHDVTEEISLRQSLSERLSFTENLVDASVDKIIAIDRNLNYIVWNKKCEEYYGLHKEQVIGKNVLEVFPDAKNSPAYNDLRRVLKGETVELTTKDEEKEEYAKTFLIPIRSNVGDVIAILWVVHDLSNEHRMQKEQERIIQLLQDEQQRLKEAQSIGHIGHFEWKAKEDTLEWSDELYRIHGLKPQSEIITLESALSFVHPDDVQEVREKIMKVRQEVTSYSITHRLIRSDGEERIVLRLLQSFAGKNGKVAYVRGTLQDITESKQTEKQILQLKDSIAQKATDKYLSLFNSIDEGFYQCEVIFDENNNPIDILYLEENPAAIRMIGQSFVGRRLREISPGYEAYWYEIFGDVAFNGTSKRMEQYSGPDKKWFSFYVTKVGGSESRQIAVVFDDITERKQYEEALQEANARLVDVLESTTDAFYALDAHFNFTYVNGKAAQLWQRTPQSLIGKHYWTEFPKAVGSESHQKHYEALQNGKPVYYETTSPILGIWIDVSIYPSKDGGLSVFFRNITERKQVEQDLKNFSCVLEQQVAERTKELQKNFAILQHAEDLAQIGSWEYDVAAEKFNWSEGMYQLFGIPSGSKVAPEIYLDHAYEEDRSVAKRIIKHLRKQHQSFEETMRIKKGGDNRLLKIKASVVHNNDGKVERLIGVDLDITDIKEAEEKIAESQMLLQQTATASPDAITIYDLQNRQPAYLNNCLAEWLHTTNETLVQMGIEGRLKLIHPDDRLKLLHFNEKVIAAETRVLSVEYRIHSLDGKMVWIRNRSKIFKRDAAGKATHLLSYLQDVTEEVQLQKELEERTQFLEALLDANTDRIVVIDKDFTIIGWNHRAEEVYATPKEKIVGKNFFSIFPKLQQDAAIMDALHRSLRGETVHLPMRKEVYHNAWSEIFYVPLKNEKGQEYAVLNILHDVTRTYETKRELRELNDTLERKNTQLESKNEEITHFAFVASHDLREPLRKISTFSDWILQNDSSQLSAQGTEYLKKMRNSVKRLNMLIEDILVLTRIHTDTKKEEKVDLNAVLHRVISEMKYRFNETGAEIEADQLPVIQANSNQVQHLFHHLIDNAIKFSQPNKQPVIKIVMDDVKGETVSSGELKAGQDYIRISFADNGLGIDPKYQKKIFQVFQQLHTKDLNTTGMGLAICRKVMENHEGMITVESTPGEGSIFSCYFPV